MVLLHEFKDKVQLDIRSHLDEQKVEELEQAAIMADDYALTHKMSSKSGNPQQKRYHGSGDRENISRNMDDRKRQGKSTENVGLVSKVEPLKPISCGHCGKPGHVITNCQLEHDVVVGDSAPIKQHPYRVSPMKKELLDKKVQTTRKPSN